MRITLVALLVACSAALRCTHTARFPLAQRRCSVVAAGGAELATLPSQLGRVASWAGEVVVVKYGGHAMTDPELSKSFAADCALMQSLGVRLVVVHGGGPQINAMLKKLEIKSEFVAGLRVTCPATMDAAEMVLCGSINKQIASSITLAGGRAVGLSGKEDKTNPSPNPDPGPNPSNLNPDPKPALSGKDDKMVTAERKVHVEEDGTEVSLGQVGEPGAVRTALLTSLLDGGIAPGHVEDRRPGALGHSRPEASAEAAPPSGTASARSSSGRPPASASLGQPRPVGRACACVSRVAVPKPAVLATQVPVIAPVAIGGDGMSYNVNADTMSGAIAAALGARALLLLTDVAGVLDAAPEDGGKLLPTLSLDDVSRLPLTPTPTPTPTSTPTPTRTLSR